MKAICGRGMSAAIVVAALLMWTSGCARYQYVLLEPPNLAQTIGKQAVRVDYPPLTYQLAERDRHLAIQINNPTDQSISLLGNRSYLVTPSGESRPLQGRLIAPHSFVGMIFPPPPLVYRAYPSYPWGWGFGYPFYHGPFFYSRWGFYDDPFFYGPVDYTVYPPEYWEWKTGQVRLLLFYQQHNPTNTVEHSFLFERRKVK